MDFSEATRQTYDRTAEEYSRIVSGFLLTEQMDKFKRFIPERGSILDLGCGSGRDAGIFSEQGYKVVGLDFSSGMVEVARKNAPLADIIQGDMRSFDFEVKGFDGIWIITSLLHVPRADIPRVFLSAYNHLRPGGILFDSEKCGEGETFEPDMRYGSEAFKLFTYFRQGELDRILEDSGFKIIESKFIPPKDAYRSKPFVEIFAQRIHS